MGATHSSSDMTVEQIQQLTPDQIQQLTPETIQSFNKEQLQSFTKLQIKTLCKSEPLSNAVIDKLVNFIYDSIDIYIKTDDENVRKTQLDDIEKLLNSFSNYAYLVTNIHHRQYANVIAPIITGIVERIRYPRENINLLVLLRDKILQPGEDAGNVAVLGTSKQAERVQNIIESITDDPDHIGSGYNKVYTSTKHRRRTTKRKSRKRVTKKKPRKRRKKYRSLSK